LIFKYSYLDLKPLNFEALMNINPNILHHNIDDHIGNQSLIKKVLPVCNNGLRLGEELLRLEPLETGEKMKTFSITSPETFTYKENTYPSSDFVLKILSPLRRPSKTPFSNPFHALNTLRNHEIPHPQTLITPFDYDYRNDGGFWIVKKISNPVNLENPKLKALVQKMYDINQNHLISPSLFNITKDNFREDENGNPYFISLHFTNSGKKHSISEELLALTQD
jgi:hypothetical protein